MRILGLTGLLLLMSIPLAMAESKNPASGINETIPRANVVVTVETYNPWVQRKVAGLSCDGQLKIAGAYKDTTEIQVTVSPDTALAFVNELLELDFFGLPEEFRSQNNELRPAGKSDLSLRTTRTFDAGGSKITIHVGPQSHSVALEYPAYGAPKAITEWVIRFREFVNNQAGWEAF